MEVEAEAECPRPRFEWEPEPRDPLDTRAVASKTTASNAFCWFSWEETAEAECAACPNKEGGTPGAGLRAVCNSGERGGAAARTWPRRRINRERDTFAKIRAEER